MLNLVLVPNSWLTFLFFHLCFRSPSLASSTSSSRPCTSPSNAAATEPQQTSNSANDASLSKGVYKNKRFTFATSAAIGAHMQVRSTLIPILMRASFSHA